MFWAAKPHSCLFSYLYTAGNCRVTLLVLGGHKQRKMTKKILKPERNCICSWVFFFFFCVWEDKNIFKEILIPKPVTEETVRKNPTGVNADTIACTHFLHKIT